MTFICLYYVTFNQWLAILISRNIALIGTMLVQIYLLVLTPVYKRLRYYIFIISVSVSDLMMNCSACVVEGPCQPRTYNFPSRPFGKTKVMHRSFQGKWFNKYTWLHYDEGKDSAYCFTCKTADEQNKLRTKYKDLAFISRGFNNW